MHFCGSEIFCAVPVLNERHTDILEVGSANYILSRILWGVNIIQLAELYKHYHELCVLQFGVKSSV